MSYEGGATGVWHCMVQLYPAAFSGYPNQVEITRWRIVDGINVHQQMDLSVDAARKLIDQLAQVLAAVES